MNIPTPDEITERLRQRKADMMSSFIEDLERTFSTWDGRTTFQQQFCHPLTAPDMEPVVAEIRRKGWSVRVLATALSIGQGPREEVRK